MSLDQTGKRYGQTSGSSKILKLPLDRGHVETGMFVATSIGPTPALKLAPPSCDGARGRVVNLAPTRCFGPTPIEWVSWLWGGVGAVA